MKIIDQFKKLFWGFPGESNLWLKRGIGVLVLLVVAYFLSVLLFTLIAKIGG